MGRRSGLGRTLEFGHLQGVTALQLDNMALQAAAV